MKKFTFIFTAILMLCSFSPEHKDRIEKPTSFEFTFENNTKVLIVSEQVRRLKTYNDNIVTHKLKLKSANVSFKTGEKISFTHDGKNWKAITITDQKRQMSVSKKILNKIAEIDFTTLSLSWPGEAEKAFDSKYLYIRCGVGTKKTFDKLPTLQLSFTRHKFSGAEIWTQVDENTTQGKVIN